MANGLMRLTKRLFCTIAYFKKIESFFKIDFLCFVFLIQLFQVQFSEVCLDNATKCFVSEI